MDMKVRKKQGGIKARRKKEKIFYWTVLALPVLQFCVFYIGVNFNSILLSLKSIEVTNGAGYIYEWVGLKNFADSVKLLFNEYSLVQSFKNSLIAYFMGLFFGTAGSLFFSYYIYKRKVLSGIFKIVLFLPSIISSAAMVIIFKYFVENAYPSLISSISGKEVGGLLSSPDTTFATILFYTIWIGFGGSVLMYVGAMNSISDSIVEAAQLDGVTPMKEFIYITLPMIYPTLVTFIVAGVAGIFINQMNLYTFKGPIVSYQDYTYGYYLFLRTSEGMTEYPQVASMGIIFTLIAAPLTFLVRKVLIKIGPSAE